MEVENTNTQKLNVSIIGTIEELSKPTSENQKRIAADRFRVIFFKELWNRCLKVCKNEFSKRPDCKQIAEDVFSDALIVAFKGIIDFKLPKEVSSDAEAKVIIIAWLSNIINNRILEQRGILKEEKKNIDSYKEFLKLNLYNGPDLKRNVEKSYDLDKVRKVWNGLCDLSKDIIHLSHQHECFPHFDHATREFQKNKKHLPKEVRKNLIEKHQTTDDNYRQVKKRAFDALFSCAVNPNLMR